MFLLGLCFWRGGECSLMSSNSVLLPVIVTFSNRAEGWQCPEILPLPFPVVKLKVLLLDGHMLQPT